jgi:sugar phosphate permease
MQKQAAVAATGVRSGVRFPWRWAIALCLLVINLVAYVDRVNLSVATPLIMAEFGLDAVQMGAVMSVFYVGYGIMNTPGGILADKYSARLTILSGLFGWSVFTWITGSATTFMQLMLIRFGFGLGEGVLAPGNGRLVYNWFKPNERATANGFWLGGMQLGVVVGGPLSAWIVSDYGWRAVFYAFGFVGVILTGVMYLLLSERPTEHRFISGAERDEIVGAQRAEPVAVSAGHVSLLALLRNPWMWVLGGGYFCVLIMWWANMSWMPGYLVAERKLTIMQAGAATALPYLAGTVGILSSGWLTDRVLGGWRTPPIIVGMLSAPFFILLSMISPSDIVCIASFSVANFLGAGATGLFWTLPMELYPRDKVGTTSGFMLTCGTISGVIAPVMIGYFVKTTGSFFWGFAAVAMVVFAGAFMAMALFRLERRVKTGQSQRAAAPL